MEAYVDNVWLVVTQKRFLVLSEDKVTSSFWLEECERIKMRASGKQRYCHCHKKDGTMIYAARFSMRHIIRVSYVVRGAQTIIAANRRNKGRAGGQP